MRFAAARRSAELYEPLRRLPEMPMSLAMRSSLCFGRLHSRLRADRFRALQDLGRMLQDPGPLAGEAFLLRLPRRVDPHLAAEGGSRDGEVEDVHRPLDGPGVALRIHVSPDAPRDLARVLHVAVVVHDDD